MSTYRVEWPCCGSATETEAWEPEQCPFCHPDCGTEQSELSRLRGLVREMREALLTLHDFTDSFNVSGVYANEDPDVKRALCASASALDKADAILKESGHE